MTRPDTFARAPVQMRRRLVMALPLLGGLACMPASRAQAAPMQRRIILMGTQVDIVTDGADSARMKHAIDASEQAMRTLAASMSRYEPESIVSRLNASAGIAPVRTSPAVMRALKAARILHRQTNGAFNIAVGALTGWRFDRLDGAVPSRAEIARQLPLVDADSIQLDTAAGTAFLSRTGMAIDLGGVAKLQILEHGLEVIKQHGITNALVNGGGDVLVSGTMRGRPWRIGIRDPSHPERLLGTTTLAYGGVVASSGDYERFVMHEGQRLHHVLDPHTGYPTCGVHGVALVAGQVSELNGLGTALMVAGVNAAPTLLSSRHGVHALVVADAGNWRTPGWEGLEQEGAHFKMAGGKLVRA